MAAHLLQNLGVVPVKGRNEKSGNVLGNYKNILQPQKYDFKLILVFRHKFARFRRTEGSKKRPYSTTSCNKLVILSSCDMQACRQQICYSCGFADLR